MQPSDWENGRPPLGPAINLENNLEKIARDRAERNAELEYTSIENYQELSSSFDATIQHLNQMRAGVGVAAMEVDTSTVRLMSPDQWASLEPPTSAPDSDAYYDSQTGTIYVRFDAALYASSRAEQMVKAYTVAHELSHKATHGLEKYSFHLNEGVADYLAQVALENGGLASFMSDEELSYRQTYLEAGPVVVGGHQLQPKDIFVEPGVGGGAYSRIPQLRLIETMQATMPTENFNALIKGCFNGDTTSVRHVIQEQFGEPLASALDDRQGLADPLELIKLVGPPAAE